MSPQQERSPVVVFLGRLLMGIGGLIAGTAGACTVVFAIGGIGASDVSGLASWLLLCLAIGGIPFAVGAALFVCGWLLVRRRVTRRD